MEYIFELFQEIVSYKEKQGLKNFILVIRVWSIRITCYDLKLQSVKQ